jgi:hypothetical protein
MIINSRKCPYLDVNCDGEQHASQVMHEMAYHDVHFAMQ